MLCPANGEMLLKPSQNAVPGVVSDIYPEWWGDPPELGPVVDCKGSSKCVSCHKDNLAMDPSHAIACNNCHGGNTEADSREDAHIGLIADPGALDSVDKTCGKCHSEVCQKVKNSRMALSPGIINQTMFSFGAKECSSPVYATTDSTSLTKLPDPADFFAKISSQPVSDGSDSHSVDPGELSLKLGADLLRRSCLRCHLHSSGSKRAGEVRGKGCSACHIAYSNWSAEKPKRHAIVRNVGITACLKCHNSNHVGGDFVGLYEKDHNRGFKSPIVKGAQAPTIYGSEQHRLSSDVHFRASMGCTDCHTLDEIHGDGKPIKTVTKNVKITCISCHLSGDHPSVLRDSSGATLLLGRKEKTIPQWNPDIASHRIPAHQASLTCSACHAAWSFQDYGLHLMLDERGEYWKWSINAAQNDPQVQSLLKNFTGAYAELIPPQEGRLPNLPEDEWKPPVSTDWISKETRPGIWYRGWTLRRWSNPPLGIDSDGKVSVLRPMYQYVISYVNGEDIPIWDRKIPLTGANHPALVVNPYTPHTTARNGRSCQDCHGSPKAAGLGETLRASEKPLHYPLIKAEDQIPEKIFRWDAFTDEKGKATQYSVYPTPAGPFTRTIIQKLLNPSATQKAEWSRSLLEP